MSDLTDQLTRAGIIALAGLLLAGSCQVLGSGVDVASEGTVFLRSVEGGCWVIETDEETYEPLSLPSQFREDGLRVRFAGEIRQDAVTFCQVGPVIQIQEIESAD